MKANPHPWRVIKNGSIEVVIYQEAAGYRVAWYFGGKRHRKFTKDGDVAVSFAKKQAAALGQAQPQNSAEVHADLRYLRELQERMGAIPVHTAVEFFEQHHARQRLAPARLDDLFAQFLAQLEEDRKSPGYRKAVRKYVAPYVHDFPGPLHQHQADAINVWMRQRTPSLHSRRHFLGYLKTVFNWSRDVKKSLPAGPTEADMVQTPNPKTAPIQVYTPAEMRTLLQFAADQEEIALLALGGFAGLRNSEITGEDTDHPPLQSGDLLLSEGAVRVTQKVQRKSVERYAPLGPNAVSWLLPSQGVAGAVVSFKKADRIIARIAERATKAGHPIAPKRNGLRRSYITYRTAILRDVPRVADECNTSPEKIRNNYRRPGLEKVAHEWFAITRLSVLPTPLDPPLAIAGATPGVRSAEN